jgi:hypothetical protein
MSSTVRSIADGRQLNVCTCYSIVKFGWNWRRQDPCKGDVTKIRLAHHRLALMTSRVSHSLSVQGDAVIQIVITACSSREILTLTSHWTDSTDSTLTRTGLIFFHYSEYCITLSLCLCTSTPVLYYYILYCTYSTVLAGLHILLVQVLVLVATRKSSY